MPVVIPRYFYGQGLLARSDEFETLLGELRKAEVIYPSSTLPYDYETFVDETNLIRSIIKANPKQNPISGGKQLMSIDAPIHPADYTAHVHELPNIDQSSKVADRLISSDHLAPLVQQGSRTVNIVIADNGLTPAYAAEIGWNVANAFKAELLGWPGPTDAEVAQAATKHANLIARVVKRYNPQAVIWDMPILPQRIDDVPSYTSVATAHFEDMLDKVRDDKASGKDESWIVVCAWSLVSREYEAGILQYNNDRRHLLSQKILEMVAEGIDVVFAAGNLGQFYPAQGAGHYDTGPHRSIFGANGLPEVLTVGAVDPTGTWIGAASQGVEELYLRVTKAEAGEEEEEDPGARKPDLCAPSWFHDAADPTVAVTGTSGACAMAAAVVAAVRRSIGSQGLPPAELIKLLRDTASGRITPTPDDRSTLESWRLGNGVLDCKRLAAELALDA